MRKPEVKAYVMDALQILNRANADRYVSEAEIADLTVRIYQVNRETARSGLKWWLRNSDAIEVAKMPPTKLAQRLGYLESRVYRLRKAA